MISKTVQEAINTIPKGKELLVRCGEDYRFKFTSKDLSELKYGNDLYIYTKDIYLDCDNITFMKLRDIGDDL